LLQESCGSLVLFLGCVDPFAATMAPLPRNSSGLLESPAEIDTALSRIESCEDDPDLDALQDPQDIEVRNTELQTHFERKMKHIAKMESHSKVAVLLIDWELEGKDYLNTEEEVSNSQF
jgi:hypothetical protein